MSAYEATGPSCGASRSGDARPRYTRSIVTRTRRGLSEQRRWAFGAPRRRKPDVGPSRGGGHPPSGRPLEHAELQQERLVDVLDGLRFLTDADGERGEADGPAAEAPAHGVENGAVDLVEAVLVDTEESEARMRRRFRHDAVAPHLCIVADTPEQAVGDTGRATRSSGDLGGALFLETHTEDARSAQDNGLQVGRRVEVEPSDEPEPVSQRTGDQAGTCRGPDQREPGDIEPDRSGRRSLADHDVELEVLHRRIQHLFHGPAEAVDLVDEENVALVEVGEESSEVACPFESRPRRDPETNFHLVGDDAGQRRLPEARRSCKQRVVDRFATLAGRAEQDLHVFAE